MLSRSIAVEQINLYRNEEIKHLYNRKSGHSQSGEGGGETDLLPAVAKRLARVNVTKYHSHRCAEKLFKQEPKPYGWIWIGCGNAYETECMVHLSECWLGKETVKNNFMFHLVELEQHIVSEVKQHSFFAERQSFIKIVGGNACCNDIWNELDTSSILYTTAIAGPSFIRIMLLYAISKRIPVIFTFEDNIKHLAEYETGDVLSRFFYSLYLRNCKFSKSNNSRSHFTFNTLTIDPQELKQWIELDKKRDLYNLLWVIYDYISGSDRSDFSRIKKYIHPTCIGVETILDKLKPILVKDEVEAAIVTVGIANLIYGKEYVDSVAKSISSEDSSSFSKAVFIIKVGCFFDRNSIAKLSPIWRSH